jgi:hypothetical protein
MRHEDTKKEIAQTFQALLATKHRRTLGLNSDEELDYTTHDLAGLEANIEEDKVRKAINDMSKENAPGPDDFLHLNIVLLKILL